jgi:anaerobic ribonucleoside-triphosphate reductase activating protein
MSDVQRYLDILITGRYEEAKRTLQRQWIGSTNQEIHFLSNRYADYSLKNGNYVEVSIEEDGSLTVLGFPML